jgi:hypothetical protein
MPCDQTEAQFWHDLLSRDASFTLQVEIQAEVETRMPCVRCSITIFTYRGRVSRNFDVRRWLGRRRRYIGTVCVIVARMLLGWVCRCRHMVRRCWCCHCIRLSSLRWLVKWLLVSLIRIIYWLSWIGHGRRICCSGWRLISLIRRLGIRRLGLRRISWCCRVGSCGICRLLFITRGWRIACDDGVAFLLFRRRSETESDLTKTRRVKRRDGEKILPILW